MKYKQESGVSAYRYKIKKLDKIIITVQVMCDIIVIYDNLLIWRALR